MEAGPLGGHVELWRDSGKQWHWRRRAANGQVIASGEAYKRKIDARTIAARQYPDVPLIEIGTEEAAE